MTYNLRAIEDLMEAIPVSYNTLSEKTGLSMTKLRNYIHNVTEPPIDSIIRIADFFQIPIDILVGRCTEEEYSEFMKGFKPAFMKLEKDAYEHYLLRRYGSGTPIIPNDSIKPNDYIAAYPYNLLDTIFKEPIQFILTDDQLAGLDYAMSSTLTERESTGLKLYYEHGLTLREVGHHFNVTQERARQILAKAIRKLRHPSRAKTIMYGFEGRQKLNEWAEKEKELDKQYCAEYIEKKQAWIEKINAIDNPPEQEEQTMESIIEDPIDYMDLSVRSYNSLLRALSHPDPNNRCRFTCTVGDVVNYIKTANLLRIRNIGKKSAIEILVKLEKLYNISLWDYCPELEEYRKESA